ncbi:uncharacterized protein LOC126899741 [Daktulosphaira vitifoliae]|uniref:uncharacterized protein LOC126899741 n=1 Tax=Daktulosphaira vitifoliae TaxID=58002 RepID=UPI0021A9B170|nr:uncharacterized protein LOC126899741 [Daktulosphaira vitifoliae]
MWWRFERYRGYTSAVGSTMGSTASILMMTVSSVANQKKKKTTTLGGITILTLMFLIYYSGLYSSSTNTSSNYLLVVPVGDDNSISQSSFISALHLTDKKSQGNESVITNEKVKKFTEGSTSKKNLATTSAEIYEKGFRLEGRNICTERTRLLIIITSSVAHNHAENRKAIRMTWMSRYGDHVSTAFLLGIPNKTDAPKAKKNGEINDNSWEYFSPIAGDNDENVINLSDENLSPDIDWELQKRILLENRKYRDIVQTNVRDTYSNLTLKSIAALEWIQEFCPSAHYVLKTDDDMFIDVQRLLLFIHNYEINEWKKKRKKPEDVLLDKKQTKTLVKNSNLTKNNTLVSSDLSFSHNPQISLVSDEPVIWGRLAKNWKPIRQPSSKYFVSRQQYKKPVYPDFCTGPAYLLSRGTVKPLYERALGITDKTALNLSSTNQSKIISNLPYLKLEDVFLTGIVAQSLGIPRKHNEAFANKRLSGRQLEKSICFSNKSKLNVDEATLSNGKTLYTKQKLAYNNIISIHMVKYHEQFDLWRRLMDGRTKCK